MASTQYAKASDGTDIAYQLHGEGPDLVYVAAASNVETCWDLPPLAQMLKRMASYSRLILFDRRGTGISGPVPVGQLSAPEQWADDVEAVLDTVGSERAAVFAEQTAAAAWCLLFAATHPERTAALALWNCSARSLAADDYPQGVPRETSTGMIEVLEPIWGTTEGVRFLNPAYADNPGTTEMIARYDRTCCTPAEFARQAAETIELDVRSALSLIRAPTLVLQRAGVFLPTPAMARYVTERIAGARYVELPGSAYDLWADNEVHVLLEELITGGPVDSRGDRVLATVMFSDIVGSTALAARLGDSAWIELLDEHDRLAERVVRANGGRIVSSTGDGLLATFDGPGRSIRAARELHAGVASHGLQLRIGIHTGEVELRGAQVGGIGVHIAARIQAAAGSGEILVSRTVKDLVVGSGINFIDRGRHVLKGVPDEWELFGVTGADRR